jgi:hypothetical protein
VRTCDGARWFAFPSVRSTYSQEGAVLLDVNKGLCCSLNVVAAQIWVTIESSPDGITVEGLVDVLETHFHVSRQRLKRDISDSLSKLERLGLLHQPVRQIGDPG